MKQDAVLPLLAAIGLVPVMALPVLAAEPPRQLERVEIVGSHLKRVDQEGPTPVTVLGSDEIAASGAERVGELLLRLPFAGAGGFDDTSTAYGPWFGSAGLSLRGLGPGATLVLLNGRRLASYGVALDNDASFVDLNSLPVAAVQRIEILRDGASAIYGADAIGGVVNIVLRRDFRGAELGLRGGAATAGDSQRGGATLSAGAGDLASDGWNAFAVLDASRQQATTMRSRSFSRSADQRWRGGLDWRSAGSTPPNYAFEDDDLRATADCPAEQLANTRNSRYTICGFDINALADLLPQVERIGGLAVASFEPRPDLRLFVEGTASHSQTSFRQAPSPVTFRMAADNPNNGYGEQIRVNWRPLGAGQREVRATTAFANLVLGAEGQLAQWDWSVAAGASRVRTDNWQQRQIRTSLMEQAVATGRLNPFAADNDLAEVRATMADATDRHTGRSRFVSAQASSDIARLDAGPLALAVGAELRREGWSTRLDPLTLSGDLAGSGTVASEDANASRRVSAVYAELNWPLARDLELQFAARHDNYDDYGASTSPKLALRWKPAPAWLLRASVGRGFLPPSVPQINKPAYSFDGAVFDPRRCASGDDGDSDCFAFVLQTQRGNPALRAERSRQHNLGVVFEPSAALFVALDVWRVAHVDKIAFGGQYIVDYEDRFPGYVRRAAPTPADVAAGWPGRIEELIDTFINVASREVRGADLELRLRPAAQPWGQLSFGALLSYMDRFDERLAPETSVQALLGREGYTRLRGQLSAGWQRGPWRAGLGMRHIGGYGYGPPWLGLEAASWRGLDLNVGWTDARSSVSLLVRNLADRDPPFRNVGAGFDAAVHEPLGRTWLLTWRRAL